MYNRGMQPAAHGSTAKNRKDDSYENEEKAITPETAAQHRYGGGNALRRDAPRNAGGAAAAYAGHGKRCG